MKDYYYILGVDEKCSVDEIKKAYRKLSHKFHPDKNDGDNFFAERFKEINEAYETLCDFKKRSDYDRSKTHSKTSTNSHTNNFLPVIEFFKSESNEFEYDKEIQFSWKTLNADLVTIKPFGNVEPVGAKKYKFKNLDSKELTFQITATNTYISKSATSTIKVTNKTYNEFYEKVKEDFRRTENPCDSSKNEKPYVVEPLIPCRRGSKWGFCTINKRLIVDYLYDEVKIFKEGFAAVYKNGKWGYIGETGNEVISCKYKSAFNFNDGLALVTSKYLVGLIEKSGYIDKTGKEVIACKYEQANSFSEGLAAVALEEKFFSGKFGYIDKNGKIVIAFKYDGADDFNNGLARVTFKGHYGYINKEGFEYWEN